MHICFISDEYPLWASGGVGSFIQTLGRHLVENNHNVTVLSIGKDNVKYEIFDEGVRIIRLPQSKWPKLKIFPHFYRIIKELERIHKELSIDIVETSELGLAFMPQKTPFVKVIRMHGGHHYFAKSENRGVDWWKAYQERLSFKKADMLIGVSKFVADETKKLLGYKQPVKIIYNPVDLDVFKKDDTIEVVKGQLLFVGTVCEKKGVHKLIEAVQILLDNGVDIKLKIVGRDWINPKTGKSYINHLKEKIPERFKDRINFIGVVPHHEIAYWLNRSELVVLPSFMEAMPIAWLEVLAMGKPLIASSTGPGKEVIEDRVTGLLCNPYDPDDIAKQIYFAISNKKEMEDIARRGQEFARNIFAMDRLTEQNIMFYESLLSNK